MTRTPQKSGMPQRLTRAEKQEGASFLEECLRLAILAILAPEDASLRAQLMSRVQILRMRTSAQLELPGAPDDV